ncbi:acylphosphatase [Pseudoxanthomonas sp. PXM01]|uniref:acylphosphatase n=1 Tax=Pseudoxanthomonas sp. PXM01 TaxID=2769295 RepID=UPI00177AB8F1|nr:acylphosphatase [Pseudoxanthomonas sp. PXM01]MBD9469778.1 acylphosphatase [Pseudoxanthomonas sp. PXM01]
MAGARFLVSGKVQGVFYRASTRERALDLGLSGRATNLPDGRVEVIVDSDAVALDALEAWLRLGPPAARVDAVVREAWTMPVNEGFVTG